MHLIAIHTSPLSEVCLLASLHTCMHGRDPFIYLYVLHLILGQEGLDLGRNVVIVIGGGEALAVAGSWICSIIVLSSWMRNQVVVDGGFTPQVRVLFSSVFLWSSSRLWRGGRLWREVGSG